MRLSPAGNSHPPCFPFLPRGLFVCVSAEDCPTHQDGDDDTSEVSDERSEALLCPPTDDDDDDEAGLTHVGKRAPAWMCGWQTQAHAAFFRGRHETVTCTHLKICGPAGAVACLFTPGCLPFHTRSPAFPPFTLNALPHGPTPPSIQRARSSTGACCNTTNRSSSATSLTPPPPPPHRQRPQQSRIYRLRRSHKCQVKHAGGVTFARCA